MNLIDSEIIFETSANENKTIFAFPESSLYLNNVYVKNADRIVENKLAGNKKGWMHIKEFALGIHKDFEQHKFTAPYYNNGEKVSDIYESIEVDKTPPENLCSKHLWDNNFPTWETDGVVNVKEAPYNAKGDSYADDTEALQKAIDEHEIVFLPKGYYRITKTLKLKTKYKTYWNCTLSFCNNSARS